MNKKMKNNRKPFFRFVKKIVRIFKRKPKIEYLGEKPQKPCIYISNHSAASGPATYELYFPVNMRMWGTFEMCSGNKLRWKYLNHIYFHKKKKFSKTLSFLLATILTPIMALFYKGMQIIASFPDNRLSKTIKISIEELERGTSILIYPENSSDGYHEILKEYFAGFWLLAKKYYEKTGKDIEIVNMYYHSKSNKVIVSVPRSYLSLKEILINKQDVANFFLKDANNMFFKNIK
ncbi:MAG: hypothetical protein IJX78_05870 [Bacilli bacterium]|nr:hypothetical protein [Bacilli bacterium]